MNDPIDLLTMGGAGGGGAVLAAFVARLFKANEANELKAEVRALVTELKAEMKSSMQEQRADFREQASELRKLMEHADARSSEDLQRLRDEVAALRRETASAHQRLDIAERDIAALERKP